MPPHHSCAAAAPAAQTSQLPHLMEFAERARLLGGNAAPPFLRRGSACGANIPIATPHGIRGEGTLVEVGLPPRHSCAAAAPAAQTSQLPHLMEFAERAGLLRWECRPAILAPRQRLRRHPPYCRSCTEIANPPPAAVNTFNRVLCDTRFVSMTYACGFSRKCASGASR